jgi:hypothetical protein
MINRFKHVYLSCVAALSIGMMSNDAYAFASPNNFSSIAKNINDSIEELPGLLTSVCYLFGILIGVLGVLKIKDHVENPSQTALKDGAVRLMAGGALFALPIVFESMLNTIGTTSTRVESPELKRSLFNVID